VASAAEDADNRLEARRIAAIVRRADANAAVEKREAERKKKLREDTEEAISQILDDEDEREIKSVKVLRDSLQSKIGTVEVDGQRLVDAIRALNAKLDALEKKQAAKKAVAPAPTGRGRGGRGRPGLDALAAEQARRKAAGLAPMTRSERRDYLQGKPVAAPGGIPRVGEFGPPAWKEPFPPIQGPDEGVALPVFPSPPPPSPSPKRGPFYTNPLEPIQWIMRGGSLDPVPRKSGPGSAQDKAWRRKQATSKSPTSKSPVMSAISSPPSSGFGSNRWGISAGPRLHSFDDFKEGPAPLMPFLQGLVGMAGSGLPPGSPQKPGGEFEGPGRSIIKGLMDLVRSSIRNSKINTGLSGEMKGALNDLTSEVNEVRGELNNITNAPTVRPRRQN